METKSRYIVTGIKRAKGTFDDDKGKSRAYDSGRLFVQLSLDESRNGPDSFARGVITEEVKCEPGFVRRLEDLPLPCLVDITTRRVSAGIGKPAREQVIDVAPVPAKADADGVLPLAQAGRKVA